MKMRAVREAFISVLQCFGRLCVGDKLSLKGQEKRSELVKEERRTLQAEKQHIPMQKVSSNLRELKAIGMTDGDRQGGWG